MWFRTRLVNPVVRLLLRSPLHPVLSRSLVILSDLEGTATASTNAAAARGLLRQWPQPLGVQRP